MLIHPLVSNCRVEAALQHWYVTGLQQQGAVPSLIASVGDSSSSLLSIVFELNPAETLANQLLRVHSQPIEIIYDAVKITRATSVTDVPWGLESVGTFFFPAADDEQSG